MQHKIFTIYDTKAEAYFPPFYLPQTSMAIRQFGDMVNDDNSQISKQHPYFCYHTPLVLRLVDMYILR